jgi:LacI family transcriptional regulator
MQALLRRATFPDAFLIGSNVMALGAIRAISDTGYKLRDFGLIGFDEIVCADLTDPPLSTIEQPTYEIGKMAGELLGARIKGDDSPPKTIILASTMRFRESSLRQKISDR